MLFIAYLAIFGQNIDAMMRIVIAIAAIGQKDQSIIIM
jgi:hypothetical protein